MLRGHIVKRLMTAALLALLAFGAGTAAFAQDNAEWKKLDDEAKSLYQQGKYDRGVEVAKKALELAEKAKGPDDPDVAASLNDLAELYRAQAQYAQAELLCQRALAVWEKALGPNHPSVATALENLAKLYRKTDRAQEAEALEKRAAEIRAIKR